MLSVSVLVPGSLSVSVSASVHVGVCVFVCVCDCVHFYGCVCAYVTSFFPSHCTEKSLPQFRGLASCLGENPNVMCYVLAWHSLSTGGS